MSQREVGMITMALFCFVFVIMLLGTFLISVTAPLHPLAWHIA